MRVSRVREARHKERVLREQQRRESASTTALGKRIRSGEFDPPSGPRGDEKGRGGKSRKMSYRYEDEDAIGGGERERERGGY